MSQLTIATQSTVHPAAHCVNPDCAAPYPQRQGNKFCQSCGAPILLHSRYLPLQRLGHGGFAITYIVYDTQTQQEKVLKVLTETNPKAVALFEQEARVLSSLRHPGIPQVEPNSYFEIAVGHPTERSLWGLVMEKINGHTLEYILKQHPQGCSEVRVINWFHQAIDILRQLHQQQIIHRDLKPANFMLRHETGQLVVIDFGGAKQMQGQAPHPVSSTRLVSPGYSPPEQITGSVVQPASDFYALGRTFIHLLTSRYPAELEDPMTGQLQWRSQTQVSVNSALADLLDDMVQLEVQQRPASAEVIQTRLCQIAPLPSIVRSATLQSISANSQLNSKQQAAVWKRPQVAKGQIARGRSVPQPAAQAVMQNRGTGATLTAVETGGIIQLLDALANTTWIVLLAGVGGGLGTVLGFELGYRSPIGVFFSLWFWENYRNAVPFLPFQFGAELFVFGAAGLGTALGLALAGGFRQRRHPLRASLMGCLGYLIGIFGLRFAALDGILAGLVVFTELSTICLTLGLGLPQPRLLYTGVAAIGTTLVLVNLATANVWFLVDFWKFLYPEMPGIGAGATSTLACVVLFSLLGAVLGGCFGISRYLVIPVFRWFR